jgi:hypothetical protein
MPTPSSMTRAKIDASIAFENELRERVIEKAAARLSEENFDLPGFMEWAKVGRTATFKAIREGKLKVRRYGDKTIVPRENAVAWRDALPSN